MISIVILSLLLRFISLNQSFWLDEAAQAILSRQDLLTLNWVADFQPPLFYILAHYWMKWGIYSEWFLRLPSVFFGVMTVYLTYYFFKKLFNEKIGRLTALLLATAPYHIYFSQEFRMYSLFTLLVLLSWLFLWEKRWALYGATILLAVFTHYFAFLVVVSQFLYIIVARKSEQRRYLKVLAISLSPFVLWLPTLHKQIITAGNLISAWPRWREVVNISFLKFPGLFLAKITVGMISPPNKLLYAFAVLIIGVIFLFTLSRLLKQHYRPSRSEILPVQSNHMLLLSYCLVPLLLSWISSLFISANSPHRLVFVLPAFYGIIAVGLGSILKRVRPLKDRTLILTISYVLAQNILFSLIYLTNQSYHRENWREAVKYTDNKIGVGGIVLSEFNGALAPMVWYSKKPEKYLGASSVMNITDQSISIRLDPYIQNTKYFILYTYLFELSDPDKKIERYLLSNGYKIVEEKDFRGVGIVKIFTAH